MCANNLASLVFNALPEGIQVSDIVQYGKPEWWERRPRLALAYALRKCPLFDWRHYLAVYEDVARAEIDPVLHFLDNGVKEGRHLFCKLNNQEKPLVSIVVYSRNMGLFLENSIASLTGQTVEHIEIIIVDDASLDDSVKVAGRLALADLRIKLLALQKPQGRLAARKAGVEIAAGHAIMFLEVGDYLRQDACQLMWQALADGYDLVRCGVVLLAPHGVEPAREQSWHVQCNGGKESVVMGVDAITSYLLHSRTYQKILFHGCSSQLARAAYASLADSYPDSEADHREMTALATNANSFIKIVPQLYHYRIFADLEERRKDNAPILTAITARLVPAKYEMTQAELESTLLDFALVEFMENTSADAVTASFNALADRFGVIELMQAIWEKYRENWLKIGSVFYNYQTRQLENKPQRIGLYYSQLLYGGIERFMLDFADLLIAHGYEVIIFLRNAQPRDNEVNPKCKIVYAPKRSDNSRYCESLRSFYSAVCQNPVDVMFFQDPWSAEVPFEAMPLRYLGVPVFLIHHTDFYLPLFCPASKHDLQANAADFKSLDKLICLSPEAELYFRSRGVNAQYMPNPIKSRKTEPAIWSKRKNNIIVIGRMDAAIKQMRECLYILAELVQTMPDARMIFLGKFAKAEEKKIFVDLAAELGLEGSIELKGYCSAPEKFFTQVAVFLSTSYGEGFPLALSEAQAAGLPVVMYDLPIAVAEDNESVIRVNQGDKHRAALEISALLSDRKRWRTLSRIAREHSISYAPERYIESITHLLDNFQSYCEVTYYKPEQYRRVIRTLGFYGAHLPPWTKKA